MPERVSNKLGREDQLVTDFGASILGTTLHNELGSFWGESGQITVGELWGYFTRYTYLPRLVNRGVLDRAIEQSLSTVLVEDERFAIASGRDAETGRYRGLIVPPSPDAGLQVTDSTLLVDVQRAQRQIEADRIVAREKAARTFATAGSASGGNVEPTRVTPPTTSHTGNPEEETEVEEVLARFFGAVRIDPDRYARDIGNVTREIIDRLAGAGAKLEITIDIQASKPEGFNESEVRTIRENSRVLKFDLGSGFEEG